VVVVVVVVVVLVVVVVVHNNADALNKKLRLQVSPLVFLQLRPKDIMNLLLGLKAKVAVRPIRSIGKKLEFRGLLH
jgi:hypothetical protein